MSEAISTFLAFTGTEDESIAKQYLDATNNDVEYAVTLYMESQPAMANVSESTPTDDELARRMQEESYNENELRAADSSVHRHETLIENYPAPLLSVNQRRDNDIFGNSQVGVFNQHFDYNVGSDGYGDHEESPRDESYPGNSEDIIIVHSDSDNDLEPSRPISRRRRRRESRIQELSATQQRLANLFKPPFDILEKIDIDTAKAKGRAEKKWILINIQDPTEFACQVLNRDFWSQKKIKDIVKQSFLFLQYHADSPNGASYLSFYKADCYPHIAILDPMTGECVYKWEDGKVPNVDEWITDTETFLSNFSLLPNSKNPTVHHEQKFDPDMLTEEQQIEYALKQSVSESAHQISEQGASSDVHPNIKQPEETLEDDPLSVFGSIPAIDHADPESASVTRVQIRFPNGKRLVKKFDWKEDTVKNLYEWIKFTIKSQKEDYGLLKDDIFTLSNMSNSSSKNLLDSLNDSIEKAGLKNASVLLEKY